MRTVFVNALSRTALPGLLFACFAAGELATAQLPPAIQIDRYLVQAERELGSGDPAAAVVTLNRIMALLAEHGLDIPEVFWIRRAQASYDAGLHDLTIESIVRYLEITGQGGEHYVTALELYDAAELAKQQAAERAAALAAEAERLAAERAAAEAERAAMAATALPAAMPEMVVIPAGTFRMGCVSGRDCEDDEFLVHDVTIQEAFEVSVYEVTFAQWDACVAGGGCGGYRPYDEGWGRGNRPVINVSWADAQAFVSWLSRYTGEDYRLLSEAEWEYVSRAGTGTAYSWGDAIGRNRANCSQSASRRERCRDPWDYTAPVGSFAANAFGVHDFQGNVHEWVENCWNGSYAGAPSDGSAWKSGDCSRRVLRGGAWLSSSRGLRSASRSWSSTDYRRGSIGFRVARTLTP